MWSIASIVAFLDKWPDSNLVNDGIIVSYVLYSRSQGLVATLSLSLVATLV